jgi:Tol biopolymer transport system component
VPSWFPDGKRIAFQSDRTGRMEVWVMNADGSGARQVTGLKK